MIRDAVGTKCIIDGKIENAEQLDNLSISDNGAVYEVIRIIDGTILFWEDHMKRMQNSIMLLKWKNYRINESKIKEHIKCLLSENKEKNCNVKIICYSSADSQKYIIYMPKTYYPDKKVYDDGVSLAGLKLMRANPHAKRMSDSYRQAVSETIANKNVYEVLLVNDEMNVTEGSRSNIFFTKDGVVYTPHKDMVLEGITRKHVLDVCVSQGIKVIETEVSFNDLSEFDGAFLSGTSIHVLPVAHIDGIYYNSSGNSCVGRIQNAFKMMIEKYIEAEMK